MPPIPPRAHPCHGAGTGGVTVEISEMEVLWFPCCHFCAGSVRANAVV